MATTDQHGFALEHLKQHELLAAILDADGTVATNGGPIDSTTLLLTKTLQHPTSWQRWRRQSQFPSNCAVMLL